MTKCVFCGREENYFKGINVIKNTGVVNYYCSSKCRKNAEKLGRDKRKVRWTEAFHAARERAKTREIENKDRIEKQKAAKKEKKATKKDPNKAANKTPKNK